VGGEGKGGEGRGEDMLPSGSGGACTFPFLGQTRAFCFCSAPPAGGRCHAAEIGFEMMLALISSASLVTFINRAS